MKTQEKSVSEVELKELEGVTPKKKDLKKYPLREAFRAGKSFEVTQKVAAILTRNVGRKFTVGVLPTGFSNSEGEFLSYRGYAGDMPIRFNYLLTSSDILYSIDMYERPDSMVPSRTVLLNGYNIVQIIYMLVDVFTGEFERYEEDVRKEKQVIKERTHFQEARMTILEMVVAWLKSDPDLVQDIKRDSFDYPVRSNEFLEFIQREYQSSKRKMSVSSLQYWVRKALEEDSALSSVANPKNVPVVTVVPGIADRSALIVDKEAKEAYEAAISDDAVEKFKVIEEKARSIAQGKQFAIGMLIYGRPGTGKTYTIEKILDEEGADWEAIKGGIDGSDALLAILYTYRDDKVILFDDNDAVMASEKAINTLKIALENKPVRRLGYGVPLKKGKITIPGSFEFTSRIIFITNKTRIDPALQSRLINAIIELNLGLDEMFNLIRNRLLYILKQYPEITDEDRMVVWDFVLKIKPVVEDIDFRRYEACLQEYLAAKESGNDKYWQKRCVQIMTHPKTWG